MAFGANSKVGAMDDMNALHFAAQNGHIGISQLLLDAGTHPAEVAFAKLLASWPLSLLNYSVQDSGLTAETVKANQRFT